MERINTMLFRKKIEPSCSYCSRGSPIGDQSIICIKKGVVAPWDRCGRFTYDPLKRVPSPPQKLQTSGIKQEDFIL
jgi:hypothetical protein